MADYWLMKSEPAEASIDDLANAPQQTLTWVGVRNYQARNFMRDQMHLGDGVLFYHSSCAEPGIAGLAEVASGPLTDPSQFEPDSPYFDARSTPQSPRWHCVQVKLRCKTRHLSLRELRAAPELATLQLLRPGSRLSITPVTASEWQRILTRLNR